MAYFGSFAHFTFCRPFFDKNNYKYKGEGHFSRDPLVSNNVRASKQLKTGQNGLFWQFSPIWHSVDQFFVWNQLDLTQKSLTLYKGRYFRSESSWIQPYLASNGLFGQFLPIWHSVDKFFGWNQLDLNQKSLTICEGMYFKIRSSWIQPYFGFKQLKKTKNAPFFWQFLPIWHSGDQFFD